MREILAYLLPLQRLFLPGLIVLLVWAIWKTVVRRDRAVGLALYLALIIIVDGFLNTGIYLPGLEKGSIRYSEVCAAFLLITQPPASPSLPPRRTVHWLLWIYFALLFVAAMRTDPIQVGIFDFRKLIIPQIVACLVAARGLGTGSEYRRFFFCLMTVVLICGLFLFWDLFFDRLILKSDMLSHPIYEHNRKLKRFGSFFLNPNYFGAFILLVFPAAFVWTLNERKSWTRLYGWVTLLVLLFCLTQTQARAALLAFGITILSLCLGPAGKMSRKRRFGFLALIMLVLSLFMPGFYEHAAKRFDSLESETAEGRSRETTWLYTEHIIADHPLIGIGLGESQFMTFMNAYGFQEKYGVEPLDAPHNSYLQAAVYAGIPALAALLLANVLLLGRAASAFLRGADEEVTRTGFGLAVGISGFLICIYTDLQLFTTVAGVYWVLFGLLLSLITKSPGTQPRGAVRVSSWTA